MDKPSIRPPLRARAAPRVAMAALAFALFSCQPAAPPPAGMTFEGLPVSGDLALARRLGFDRCIPFTNTVRCRRNGVTIGGEGPFNAAVDLRGGRGQGGCAQLTLWHDADQTALYRIADFLERRGWTSCYKQLPGGEWGDQKIYTRPDGRVRIAMDLTYYMKRRLRIIPEWNPQKPRC